MFETQNLSKQYGPEFALRDITMTIGRGMNFIVGASGSGKTTLLKILCGMERGFTGSVTYCGKDISSLSQAEKSALYNQTFGFVWQDFHLLEEAIVLQNILLPACLQEETAKNAAVRILKQMKLEDLKDKKVRYLSGGQKQRVAIGRELMKNPQVIFCDEPTSALDAKSAKIIMEILRSLAKNRTVIVVTHDTSLIRESDAVFELDKGELVAAPAVQPGDKALWKESKAPRLSFQNAFRIARSGLKNRPGRFLTSVLSLLVAGTLLLTTVSGAIGQSGQSEFDKLVDTYGEGILDISLVGSFMSASGAGGTEEEPGGSVSQDISSLYEKYENDPRVRYIISSQAFDNIEIGLEGKTYTVEETGSTPVLTKLLSGSIPAGEDYQVVLPLKFVESLGLTPETALGKEIAFSATVYQWVNDQPLEKPVALTATVCGVADNTVVYDYGGKPYTYTVDDSFFFNRAAIAEVRRQADIRDNSANFIMRANTPEDLISLKDELNRAGIVPLGQFELVEDIVRLNQQTARQSGSANAVIGVLAAALVVIIFAMTAILRKREYAIYKVSGFHSGHLMGIAGAETALSALAAAVLMLVASPLLNLGTEAMFSASILSPGKLALGVGLILTMALPALAAGIPAVLSASVSTMLKAGDKA